MNEHQESLNESLRRKLMDIEQNAYLKLFNTFMDQRGKSGRVKIWEREFQEFIDENVNIRTGEKKWMAAKIVCEKISNKFPNNAWAKLLHDVLDKKSKFPQPLTKAVIHEIEQYSAREH